jgi:hypothetical protein
LIEKTLNPEPHLAAELITNNSIVVEINAELF